MTKKEYDSILKKIAIHEQVQTFIKYVVHMREIYPQFKQMTLDQIYEFLNRIEAVWETEIQNDLNVK